MPSPVGLLELAFHASSGEIHFNREAVMAELRNQGDGLGCQARVGHYYEQVHAG